MAGQRLREKQRTRDRISQVATSLFLARGFEEVTVAEVAAAAGVSKVTVFAHFPRKEDLLLDRAPEAVDLLRSAVGGRPDGVLAVEALRRRAVELAEQRHPLSGLGEGAAPFLRTVFSSPALLARMRELTGDLEAALSTALAQDPSPVTDPRLLASLLVAAYRTVMTETAEQVLNGVSPSALAVDHRRRLNQAFDVLAAAAAALGT